MGKKRIIKKSGKGLDAGRKERAMSRVTKRHLEKGILHIEATFNNTKAILTDEKGNAIISSSAGALGFSGARKSTPYAAAKVGEFLGEKGTMIGLKEASVVIRGVGAGRQSVLRAFSSKGIQIRSIKDATPVPHNGPRPPKPRRV
ncbi:30S ribosomal protein S11 [Candidatus Kaiserbacteria bacterium RIFCSPLOWO2_12_FULL_52_8]|uniref:Small ribosomal subunit protein uS11 n=1 Tax=Candidatus Kaiserbacteria bacterium RIFCSPHIGHO2_01_FULL_53_31 TaxID=1798481 RepID=A0A1F6CHF3_9BACT|nr:MAG: 30S ribosomal protein S11 [Candidatus Kaiserbacteria bacterium RIFCSPHIGHO2_01_FULL_53_31]OGG94375.1 MAG: 30S ribosomal protein S11 [Candidatus Kaiserbacteria bacterium RIFCSPLOWO2_12_FULL_52_8]